MQREGDSGEGDSGERREGDQKGVWGGEGTQNFPLGGLRLD